MPVDTTIRFRLLGLKGTDEINGGVTVAQEKIIYLYLQN